MSCYLALLNVSNFTSEVDTTMFNNGWKLNNYITYFLLTLVLLSTWTDVSGIFSELPQIVLTQPEGWKLGAYVAVITNMGNIAPLALVLFKCAFGKHSLNLIPISYVVIFVGMVSCLLLVFFWSNTSFIFNQNRSISLLILSFFLSLLDCTSMVTFSDYLTRFRSDFTSSLFLGESLTAIIPSVLAIAQGNGQLKCVSSFNNNTTSNMSTTPIYKTARFSVSIYFLCIFFLLTISCGAFVVLQWTKIAQNSMQVVPAKEPSLLETNHAKIIDTKSEQYTLTAPLYRLLLLACIYTSAVIFGVLLAISAYVLMPYGHQIFYLGTILYPWMLSFTWLIGMMKPFVAKRYLLIMIILESITFSFNLVIAFKSPCPPFVNTTKGIVFVLFIWLSTYVLLGYPRLIIANYVRVHSPSGMFWFGVNVQLGAFIGSVIAYLLVDTFSLFREQLPCEQVQC